MSAMTLEELEYRTDLKYTPNTMKAYRQCYRLKSSKLKQKETEKLLTRRQKMRQAIKEGRTRRFGYDKGTKIQKHNNFAKERENRDFITQFTAQSKVVKNVRYVTFADQDPLQPWDLCTYYCDVYGNEAEGEIVTQSSHGEMSIDESTMSMDRVNVQEIAPSHTTTASGENDQGVDVGGATKAPLSTFFERPISIFDTAWIPGQDIYTIVNPWDLWSKDPTIRAKLSNYAYFKGKCHLRVSVTGTPFHYGRIMISYQPFRLANDNLWVYEDLYTSGDPGPLSESCYLTYLSQAPGVVYLDVKENEPTEMVLPFMFPKTRARLFNYDADALAATESYSDLAELGSIYIKSVNPIAVANEDYNSSVSVNIYAWMTDVELGTITGTDATIVPQTHIVTQSKPRNRKKTVERKAENIIEEATEIEESTSDEPVSKEDWYAKKTSGKPLYDSGQSWGQRISGAVEKAGTYDESSEPGPVATIASAVAKVGDTLADIPVIGGFAKATSTVAKGVGKVASWFGFSKPLVLDKQMFVRNVTYLNDSVLASADTAKKVAADSKQELALRLDLGGIEQDQMAINTITARESYLATAVWSSADTALVTSLYRIAVTPRLFNKVDLPGTKTLLQPTAVAFACQPFRYWRGSMTYRVEFVCSKFHRGKAIIRYEPNSSQSTLISSASAKLNQHNTLIVDLQETQCVDVTVGWTHDRAFCRYGDIDNNDTQALRHGTTLDVEQFDIEENIGWIDIRPFNELVQPTDDSNVPINIYVRSNDMSVAVPTSNLLTTPRRVNFTESNVNTTSINLNKVETNEENVFLDHFGEKIISFRSLLKRYQTFHHHIDTAGSGGKRRWYTNVNMYNTPKNSFTKNAPASYQDANGRVNLFDYLRYGYMGIRGGMRQRYKLIGNVQYQPGDCVSSRVVQGFYDYYNPDFADSALNSSNMPITHYLDANVTTVPSIEGAVEIDIPNYSLNLFKFAFTADFGDGAYGETFLDSDNTIVSTEFQASATSNGAVGLQIESATAEDFSFLRFQGAPLYAETTEVVFSIPLETPEWDTLSVNAVDLSALLSLSSFQEYVLTFIVGSTGNLSAYFVQLVALSIIDEENFSLLTGAYGSHN